MQDNGCMTLDETIEKLQNIKKKVGHGNTKMYFSDCRVVPLYDVDYLLLNKNDYVMFITKHRY